VSRDATGRGPITAPALVRDVLATPGSPLEPTLRTDMEQRLGHDFSRVRIHADARAADSTAAVASLAYTVGNHVVLSRALTTGEQSRRVLAHELVHTIQQRDISSPGDGPLPVSSPSDAGEKEAENLAQLAIRKPAQNGNEVAWAPFRPVVQRACGGPEIGSVSGCAERGGDIADFGSSSEDVFLFIRDCDDLAPGESARLAGYRGRIGPDNDVAIDGFASEEGPAEFNRDLACARARAAADVLAMAGVVPRSLGLYSHGATPGDRTMHRSVVITTTPPLESPAPVPIPAPTPAPAPPTPGKTYSFNITTDGCADKPYIHAIVVAAAKQAFDTVSQGGCVKSASLKDDILSEFDGLNIDCEQGDEDDPCGMASRYFTHTVNIYPKSLDPARCGPLASTILHEVVHLTEWRLFGHGELADACEKACFGFGSGDASKCK
jgi:outer membrane protein OmpA-like peptidoglycan-associated protein